MRAIRVVLVDDHAMVRQGLAQVLQDSEEIKVVGQACDGLEGIDLVKTEQPDVVVLDYTMPRIGGVTAVEQIRKLCPKTKILVLTVHENIHYAVKVLEAGAHGFVIKAAAVQELVQGVRSVHEGRVYVSPLISEKMTASLREGRHRSGVSALSKREFQLLTLLGGGMRLQDCAEAMQITESTASTYRARILEKLKLKTTAELIRFALENGIVG